MSTPPILYIKVRLQGLWEYCCPCGKSKKPFVTIEDDACNAINFTLVMSLDGTVVITNEFELKTLKSQLKWSKNVNK